MRTIYIICMLVLLSAIMVTPTSAMTWYVHEGESIQNAINSASDGDTVFVYNGTYNGEFAINKPNITLKGEGADKVILSGDLSISGNIIAIGGTVGAAPGCIVEGFTLTNDPVGIAIFGNAPHCIIRNNVIEGMTYDTGSIIITADNTTFTNNVVVNSTGLYGAVYVRDSQFSKVVNNTIKWGKGAGVTLENSGSNIVAKNNLISNGYSGIELYNAGEGNKIYLNNFIDNGLTATTSDSTEPTTTYWNSTEPIEYVYNGTTYTNYLGNYWSDYSGADGDSNGIGDTNYVVPESLGEDYRPLMAGFENYPPPTPTPLFPELIPTAIKPYHFEWWDAYNVPKGDPWFNLTNYVNVTVNNTGAGSASSFKVKLYADDELIGEKTISGLSAGSSAEEKIEWKPTGSDPMSWVDTPQGSKVTYTTTDRTYTLKAVVDEANEVPEENEDNNNLTKSQKVVWNGYTGDQPLENYMHGSVQGGMFYSTGNGAYQGVGNAGTTYGTYYNVSYNLEIPGTPKLSRLYIYYTWAQNPTLAPKIGVTLTTPSGIHTLSMDKGYNDYKGEFGTWRYPWGTYAYNITDYVTAGGNYEVSVTNLNDGSDANFSGNKLAFAAPAILTVYENDSMPLREYWINEGADILLGGRRGDGGFLAWWECMNNATFPGSVSLKNATLGIVSPWADNAPDDEVYFNDQSLGKGIYSDWNTAGTLENGGLKMVRGSNTQVSIYAGDVTSTLAASNNRLTQVDDGDNMMPSNAFLLVNAPEGTLTVNKVVVPGTDTGKFNLQIDGTTKAADVSNGGTTGQVQVSTGSHTVSEVAGTGTSLSQYTTVISGDCAPDGTVTLADGDNKVCTITNTRIPTLTVNKVVVPVTDTGKFNLQIDGATKAADVSNGGTTGQVQVSTGSHTVGEIAGAGTNLSLYTAVISGDCAPVGTVALAAGDNKVCIITNTNKSGMKIDLGGPYDTEIGRHIMIPIKANQFTKFYGTVEMNFSYNTSKFDVVGVHSSSQSTVTAYQDYPSTGILDISALNAAGVRGDVVLATVELKVVYGKDTSSQPELTVDLLEDIYGATIFAYTVPATVNIGNPGDLTVTSVTSTPQSFLFSNLYAILNENARPRHTGDNETEITAQVTNSGMGINSVTVDLSAIGGSAATLMEGPYPDTGTYKVKTKATAGVNGTHSFVVTAKDNGGNTATNSTNSLTIYRRGDVMRNNIVDMGDSLYIARYTVGLQTITDMNNFKFVGDLMPASDSDYTVNMGDALYIARHSVGLEPAP